MLEKVKPTTAQETVALKSAKEQIQLGTKAIVERQKLIHLADNEKDAKRIEKAEKAVELKNRRKRKPAG